jgi:gentisate 1,2-dioxygenase
MVTQQSAKADTLEQLDQDMAQKHLEGYWLQDIDAEIPIPKTSVQPFLWKWADVYESLVRAGELVSLEQSERRTARMFNPGLKEHYVSQTLQLSVQYVKPGEHARAHRHTMAALRYVVRGRGAYTTVNGQQCVMEPGDLILTPQWTWHDHTNDSDEPIIWLDGLDIPLIRSLHQLVLHPYSSEAQEVELSSDEVSRFAGQLRPPASPLADYYHYRWRDIYPALQAVVDRADPDPFEGYLIEYRNPRTGGPTMPTIGCALQLLHPGQRTAAHRHTSTFIYHAFRGSGTTVVGDHELNWEEGDTFVIPVWHRHSHQNRSTTNDAILFSMSDSPVLQALGLLREEVD